MFATDNKTKKVIKGKSYMTQNVNEIIEDTMKSYYEYIVKIENGCTVISNAFIKKDFQTGVINLQFLSEGLSWLIEAENLMLIHSYQIESPIKQAIDLFKRINSAISNEDFEQVGKVLENELKPLFKNASDWKFTKFVG